MSTEALTRKFFEAVKAAGAPSMEQTGTIPLSSPMMTPFSSYLDLGVADEDVSAEFAVKKTLSEMDKVVIAHTLFFRAVCREFMKRVLSDIDVEDYDFLAALANKAATKDAPQS